MRKMLVFNSKKWNKAGGDVGDNSQFWEEAEILYAYSAFGEGELVAAVRWPDGTESRGHIISCMKPLPPKTNPENDPPPYNEEPPPAAHPFVPGYPTPSS